VKENGEVLLGCGVSEGTVGDMLDWGWDEGFGGQWDVPKAIFGIAFADDDDFSFFLDFDVVFCENGDTIVVAKLPNRD
jgi:hypothetical protein